MITLGYPSEEKQLFFYYDSHLFGPLNGSLGWGNADLPIDLDSNVFAERRGIYGENHIRHSSCTGFVNYYPIMADCIADPTSYRPRQIKVPVYQGGAFFRITVPMGFAIHGETTFHQSGSYNEHRAFTYSVDPNTGSVGVLIALAYGAAASPQMLQQFSFYTLNLTKIGDYLFKIIVKRSRLYNIYGGLTVPYDLSHPLTWNDVMDLPNKVPNPRWTSSQSTTQGTIYEVKPSKMKPPSLLIPDLDVFLNALSKAKSPVKEVHFGELAQQAVRKKRAITTNMIEFLSDLRNPLDLIPKLKNLRSLKGIAGTFLSVKYGILPTISDIQSVIDAFKRAKPYFDKNGFTVFTAYHEDAGSAGNCDFSLEQHIKVAIDDTENLFLRLLETVDNVGLLPTFENLWDLVNYSFVIDWLVDVGSFLEQIDTACRLLRYNIRYCTMSTKKEITGQLTTDNSSLSGWLTWRYYHRWVTAHCPLPPLTLDLFSPTISNHWLEVGALIIQRT